LVITVSVTETAISATISRPRASRRPRRMVVTAALRAVAEPAMVSAQMSESPAQWSRK
jgi:hypothetical protein